MKKNYQKPSIEVIKFKMKSHLLTGSGMRTERYMRFHGDRYDIELDDFYADYEEEGD